MRDWWWSYNDCIQRVPRRKQGLCAGNLLFDGQCFMHGMLCTLAEALCVQGTFTFMIGLVGLAIPQLNMWFFSANSAQERIFDRVESPPHITDSVVIHVWGALYGLDVRILCVSRPFCIQAALKGWFLVCDHDACLLPICHG